MGTSATLTPTSSAAAPTRVSDERQIIRVAQPVSPGSAESRKIHGGLEIRTPGGLSVIPQASLQQQPPLTSAAVVDMKKKAAQAAAQAHHAQMEREQRGEHGPGAKSGSPNGDGGAPGLSALDYVTNKIAEEMKKHGEDGKLVPGQKRASPPLQPGEENSAAKKGKPDAVDFETGNAGNNLENRASASSAAIPPESPGSPGDMVIDESSETTPKAALSPATTAAATPVSEAAAGSGSGNTNTKANTSKYEPLSDDE